MLVNTISCSWSLQWYFITITLFYKVKGCIFKMKYNRYGLKKVKPRRFIKNVNDLYYRFTL